MLCEQPRGLIARLSLPLAGLTGITRIWGNTDESIVLAGHYGNELAALGYSYGCVHECYANSQGGLIARLSLP